MAYDRSISRYDAILAQRARNSSYAELAEQRSASRREAAQRTMAQGDSTRNTLVSNAANTGAGLTKLTEMLIRTRVADEAKARTAEMAKKYA